jgi:hypothetical protein
MTLRTSSSYRFGSGSIRVFKSISGQLDCRSGIERQVSGAKKFLLNLKHIRIGHYINPAGVFRPEPGPNHHTSRDGASLGKHMRAGLAQQAGDATLSPSRWADWALGFSAISPAHHAPAFVRVIMSLMNAIANGEQRSSLRKVRVARRHQKIEALYQYLRLEHCDVDGQLFEASSLDVILTWSILQDVFGDEPSS